MITRTRIKGKKKHGVLQFLFFSFLIEFHKDERKFLSQQIATALCAMAEIYLDRRMVTSFFLVKSIQPLSVLKKMPNQNASGFLNESLKFDSTNPGT